MLSPSNSLIVTVNSSSTVSPTATSTLFQVITLSTTETFSYPFRLSSTRVVPSGTTSLTVVVAVVFPLFSTLIVYVTSEPSSNTSDVLVEDLYVSIIGFVVSGVSLPSTTATFEISVAVSSTITVNETVTVLFLATSTIQEILPFSTVPLLEIEFSFNVVPVGTISETLTPVASIFSLLFVIEIS